MNYKELLSIIKTLMLPNKDSVYNSIIKPKNKKMPKWLFIAAGSAVVIALMISTAYLLIMNSAINKASTLPDEFKNISPVTAVIPTQKNNDYIKTETEFTVVTSDAVDKADLGNILSIYPDTEYSVTKLNGNTFKISFTDKLKNNTVYTFSSLKGINKVYSWAFQTETDLKVISHSPKNNEFTECNSISIEFSHGNIENFEQYFSIYPSIPGTFEHYGNTWKFIPSVEFDKNTAYTVTVSKDITNKIGSKLNEDYIFSFVANTSKSYIMYSEGDLCDTFTTSQKPVASLYFENPSAKQANITVFKISDTNTYISLRKKYTDNTIVSYNLSNELQDCVKVYNFTQSIQSDKSIKEIYYPNSYDTGYYISEIITETGTFYHTFQVNDIAVYVISYDNNYTLWVNSLNSSSPVIAANIECDGNSRLTDSDGIAQFTDCIITGSRAYFTVKHNNSSPYVISVENKPAVQNDCYLYIDKKTYSSRDTVNVYGFTDIASDNLSLICSWNEKQIKIAPDNTGIFISKIELTDNFCAGENKISLYKDNYELCSRSFYLEEYQRAEYNIDIITDKASYFRTENIEYTIYVTQLDGTPAVNTEVKINDDTVTTDQNGYAIYSVKATYDDSYGKTSNAAPSKLNNIFYIQNSDGTYTKKEHNTLVFDTDTMIDIVQSDKDSFDVTLFVTDLNKFTDGYYDYGNKDFFGSQIPMSSYASAYTDSEITVEVYKLLYKPDYKNAVYNSVTDEKIITYYNSETLVSSEKYTSQEGKISIPYSLIPQDDGNYFIKVSADGQRYGTAYTKLYLFSSPEESDRYTFADKNGITVFDCRYDNTVTNGVALINIFTDNGIKTETVNFEKESIFSLSDYNAVTGVYYDGNSFYTLDIFYKSSELNTITATVNAIDGAVDLDISSSFADSCINVTASDSADGFITATEMDKYTRNDFKEISKSYSSYVPPYVSDVTEQEQSFLTVEESSNTLYFQTAKTDSNGKAKFSFDIPSNIKYLYITVQCVTKDGVSSIQKTIPLSPSTQEENKLENTVYNISDIEITDNTKIYSTQFTSYVYAHIYDEDMSFYYTVVRKLLGFSNENYSEVLAGALSDSMLKNGLFGTLTSENTNYINKYLSNNTIENESVLTAVANEYFDSKNFVEYFRDTVNNNVINEQTLSSYFVLASLGQPILDNLNSVSVNSLNEKELMYLALAYAYIGDRTSATEIFEHYIKDKIKFANDIAFYSSETQTQTNDMTLLAVLLTSKISPYYSKALVKYVLNNNIILSSSALYLAEYVKNYIPVSYGSNVVQITEADGSINKTEISKSQPNTIFITQNNLDKISFKSVLGVNRLLVYGK